MSTLTLQCDPLDHQPGRHRSQSSIVAAARFALFHALDDSENQSNDQSAYQSDDELDHTSLETTRSINQSIPQSDDDLCITVTSPSQHSVNKSINQTNKQSLIQLQQLLDEGTESFNNQSFDKAFDQFSSGLLLCVKLPVVLGAHHYALLLIRRSQCAVQMIHHQSNDQPIIQCSDSQSSNQPVNQSIDQNSLIRRAISDAEHSLLLVDSIDGRMALVQALLIDGLIDRARQILIDAKQLIDRSDEQCVDLLIDQHSVEDMRNIIDQSLSDVNKLINQLNQTREALTSPKQSPKSKRSSDQSIKHSISHMSKKSNDIPVTQSTTQLKLSRDEKRLHRFHRWLKEGQCFSPFIHIQSTSQPINQSNNQSVSRSVNRGIFALTDIKSNSLIASINQSRILTLSEAMSSPIIKALIKVGHPNHMSHSLLAVYVHYHMFYSSINQQQSSNQSTNQSAKQSNSQSIKQSVNRSAQSPWKPYLDMLPSTESFKTSPLFYQSNERSMLAGTDVDCLIDQMRVELKGEYDLLMDCLKKCKRSTKHSNKSSNNQSGSWFNQFANIFSSNTRTRIDTSSRNVSSSQSVNRSIDQSTTQSVNQTNNQSLDESINQPMLTTLMSRLSFDQYLYYRLIILSRVFALPQTNKQSTSRSVKHELCLVPIADMFNAYLPNDQLIKNKIKPVTQRSIKLNVKLNSVSTSQTIKKSSQSVKSSAHHTGNQTNKQTINHSINVSECCWHWDVSSNSLQITSVDQISSGAELRHSYGAKCSRRWLLHYGHVPINNAEHHAILVMQTNQSVNDFQEKIKLMKHFSDAQCELAPTLQPPSIKQTGNQCPKFHLPFLLSYSSPLTRMSWAMLRLYVATSSEMAVVKNGLQKDAYLGPISVDNELAALSLVALAAQSQLARHTSGLDEEADNQQMRRWNKQIDFLSSNSDEDSIRKCRALRNKISILRFMHSERRILQFYASLSDRVAARVKQARVVAGHTRSNTVDDIRLKALSEIERSQDVALDEYWKCVFQSAITQM